MPHMKTLDLKATKVRPYELPRQQYALWYDVGTSLGAVSQTHVANALCNGTHKIFSDLLINGEADVIRRMAERRGVLLRFE